METKSLLYGLIGFFIGGLIVSLAATAMAKENKQPAGNELSMDAMTASLAEKTGDSYDEAFIHYMIEHHQSAVDMAKLSPTRAKHEEIKQLSLEVIAAQEREITQMRQWLKDWKYSETPSHSQMNH